MQTIRHDNGATCLGINEVLLHQQDGQMLYIGPPPLSDTLEKCIPFADKTREGEIEGVRGVARHFVHQSGKRWRAR